MAGTRKSPDAKTTDSFPDLKGSMEGDVGNINGPNVPNDDLDKPSDTLDDLDNGLDKMGMSTTTTRTRR